ncbi:MAG: hypothetical protein L0Z68_03715 [Gammaproteobacteria bacterium]|nr:hypothetical protein [Gammaproteobacteria bacterium]
MFIKPVETASIARLFEIIGIGERLAEEGARRQLALTDRPDMQRFFRQQAAQERFHRVVFEKAVAFIAPRGYSRLREFQPLAHFQRLVEDACERRDLAETLFAQQIVLEGFGEVVFERIDVGMTERGFGLETLRRALRRQEHAHHQFGLRKLHELRQLGYIDVEALKCRAVEYVAVTDQALEQLADLFTCFGEDPAMYRDRLHEGIPHWLRPA